VTFAGLDGARLRQPQWAHDGRQFVALTRFSGSDYALVAQPGSATPVQIAASVGSFQSLPTDAWSPDNTRLAIVGSQDTQQRTALFLINPAQSQVITVDATFDSRAALNWHPRESRLIMTSHTAGFTPTLRIVGPDGKSTEFAPQDKQAGRAFGAWSPDGGQIAYVVTAAGADTRLRGGIWTANSDASNVRPIVQDGLNFAPIWSPAGDAIYFTRWLTQTDSYELYRVRADGTNLVRIGAGTPTAGIPRSLEWSPDQSKLLFQSFDHEASTVTLWIANGDGSNPQSVLTETAVQGGYLAAHWAPTGRALLIATPENTIVLHWLDAQRLDTLLAEGNAPNWQP
jgi:Tol biopolymer transport system component